VSVAVIESPGLIPEQLEFETRSATNNL
jgi:hypothetical protein